MQNDGIVMNCFFVFIFPLALMLMFYANYFSLIPNLLFKSRYCWFLVCNAFLVAGLAFSLFYVHSVTDPSFKPSHEMTQPHRGNADDRPPLPFDENFPPHEQPERTFPKSKQHHVGRPPMKPKENIRILNDILVLLFVCLVSVLLRYTKRWFSSYSEMKDLEKEKVEVELLNLKNQLNPHFLFNTLNNIYALIGIQQDRAQQAVLDLSKLLRYALYEGEKSFVTLQNEADFIENYIKLMKLRLPDSVKVTYRLSVVPFGNLPVAQMLFISLVENAFKHGVCLSKPSFIDMNLSVNDDKVVSFSIENSFFPKDDQDKSGSGVGIENLKRRLQLLYPGRFSYNVTANDLVYKAILQIQLNDCL